MVVWEIVPQRQILTLLLFCIQCLFYFTKSFLLYLRVPLPLAKSFLSHQRGKWQGSKNKAKKPLEKKKKTSGDNFEGKKAEVKKMGVGFGIEMFSVSFIVHITISIVIWLNSKGANFPSHFILHANTHRNSKVR